MVSPMMGPVAVCVNHGKARVCRCVEIGMIEINIEELTNTFGTRRIPYLAGGSGDLYRVAKTAYEIMDAQADLKEKQAAHDAASKRVAKVMQYHTVATPTDIDGLWKLVRRMRENRGAPPPTITCGDGLHDAVMDLLRMEIEQFDAALQTAKDKLAQETKT